MEKVFEIVNLLGEDNVKKLKDSITDLLIEQVRDDLKDYGRFMIDYNTIFEEVEEEIGEELKVRVRDKYMEMVENKFPELFENNNGEINR